MSDGLHETAAVPRKEDPETLVLRGAPRPVVRFRRGLIIGISGAVAASLAALAWLALEPPSFRMVAGADEGRDPPAKAAPDALAGAPSSYGEVPRLGPPLPGDLGRPILEHQRRVEQQALISSTPSAPSPPDNARAAAAAERQRRGAAEEAARRSGVIVQLAGRVDAGGSSTPVEPGVADSAKLPAPAPAISPPPQAGPVRRLEFSRSESGDFNQHSLRASPSPWTLAAGTIIPASLITGLNSDLPGTVFAQVTESVRDSATGRTVLIPQGARLVGSYDSLVAFGQKRALLVWQRIVFPDGSSIRLDNMPAADLAGFAGLRDGVDLHTWRLLSGIALSTLFGVGTELSFGSGESDLVRAIRESTQQNAARAGDRIISRNLEVQPTLTVRPGWPLRVVIHKDLVLRPWRG
ncbi:MAG TPA: TrbI/VirB10 family protein [Allosphingosinicella sp.]|uniref:TrbI/VirB10 family protein n=1 Tax=Allosphingosinicella sp. TaxID=2823234 RepID=UPI002F283FF0